MSPRTALHAGLWLGAAFGLLFAVTALDWYGANPNVVGLLSIPFSLIGAAIASFAPERPR